MTVATDPATEDQLMRLRTLYKRYGVARFNQRSRFCVAASNTRAMWPMIDPCPRGKPGGSWRSGPRPWRPGHLSAANAGLIHAR